MYILSPRKGWVDCLLTEGFQIYGLSREQPAQHCRFFMQRLFKKGSLSLKSLSPLVRVLSSVEKSPRDIHHMRNFSAKQVLREQKLVKIKNSFFSDVRILREFQVAQAPDWKEACVLTGGTFISHPSLEISDSEQQIEDGRGRGGERATPRKNCKLCVYKM